VPVVRLQGVIGGAGPLRTGMSLTGLSETLDRAFSSKRAKAVALAINSPGGSPVQAALIAERIRAHAREKEVPVLAFCEDVAASGGYWLACAADEIYAEQSSIIGSIGVISAGFGFHELLEKYGVERRVHTSGARKSMLDPFQPQREEDVARLKELQADIHENFRALVRKRRGSRLKASEDHLFSGDIWTGKGALEVGLIDGIGNLRGVLRERFGENVVTPLLQPRRGLLRRLRGGGGAGSESLADGVRDLPAAMLATVEERLWWNRFGL
jgi:signal peptide peptidase SppA